MENGGSMFVVWSSRINNRITAPEICDVVTAKEAGHPEVALDLGPSKDLSAGQRHSQSKLSATMDYMYTHV
jgi:hypothetical protein